MLKIAIINHEKKIVDLFQDLIYLNAYDLEFITSTRNLKEDQKLIQMEKPDLILFNLTPDASYAFKLLQLIECMQHEIILISNELKHALDAIKWRALDFILKPVEWADIQLKLRKALNHITAKKKLQNIIQPSKQKLAIPVQDGHKIIKIKDILYFKADSGYTHIFLTNGKKLLVSKKLGWIEKEILNDQFIRVHRSFIANKMHVSEVQRSSGGAVIISDQYRLPLSIKYKPLLKLL